MREWRDEMDRDERVIPTALLALQQLNSPSPGKGGSEPEAQDGPQTSG